ncbi:MULTISPECIES: RacP protein [unclassified Streptomyces]|uniref:RacP protein n=1 Tax=unclassified Streptomyces TaxID=2593676 RepID=UPI002365A95F|nr:MULTISPECIES: RacP protein [unclassified Streptomyces]MDF3141430.1 RacP protein [Streptomyces sp. T21Q-yed]WDF35307.1 RacP protein [Streptomyces sp. T12]WDF44481.1 RacP protein [Streptomyces sp. T12]
MPRSRKKGDAARGWAKTIRRVLLQARPAGLHMPQLIEATELTRSQVRSGLAMLRDIIADNGWPPLVYTRADGYQFTIDGDVLQAYEVGVVREELTEIRRLITGTVTPHAAAAPEDKWVRHIVARLNSVESTLDLVA